MTFSEYRDSFRSKEEFMQAFGRLTYENAHALIDAEEAAPSIKACMITTWRKVREQLMYSPTEKAR